MILSHDLNNLAAFVSLEALSDHEMTPETRELLTMLAGRIEVCAGRAASLEAEAAIRALKTAVTIDLSDSKIALFPRAKRPVPASGSNPRNGGDAA